MSNIMRVCHLIHHLANGGLEQQIYELVRHGDDEQEHTICYLGQDDTLAADLRAAGATVVDVDRGRTGPRGVFDPRTTWAVASLLRERRFDVLHAHTPLYVHVVGRVAAAFAGTPVVGTYHNRRPNFHPVMQALERATRPLSSVNVGVSKAVERSFGGNATEYTPDNPGEVGRSCTIYNGIDVEAFRASVEEADTAPLREKYGLTGDELVFLNVGRYTPQKAQLDLVRAMDDVVAERPDARLFVVGWGQMEAELDRAVREQGLEDHVTITGKVPTVEEYYAVADVFVLSSLREGLPIVLLEAMAAGLPVVSTRVSGVPEAVIDGETGHLAPAESPSDLATEMVRYRSAERRERAGERGYRRALEQFDIDRTGDQYGSLYRSLARTF